MLGEGGGRGVDVYTRGGRGVLSSVEEWKDCWLEGGDTTVLNNIPQRPDLTKCFKTTIGIALDHKSQLNMPDGYTCTSPGDSDGLTRVRGILCTLIHVHRQLAFGGYEARAANKRQSAAWYTRCDMTTHIHTARAVPQSHCYMVHSYTSLPSQLQGAIGAKIQIRREQGSLAPRTTGTAPQQTPAPFAVRARRGREVFACRCVDSEYGVVAVVVVTAVD